MKILEFVDMFNSNKIWIVKEYKCGHFYMNQSIGGVIFYKKFVRVNRSWLNQLFLISEVV